ncbi:MAG: HAD family hydrolase [Ruminococcus sp.]
MKKLIIIGYDGTIADTSPGILYCMNTTANAMGYTPVHHDALYGVIGVSLEQGFMSLYGMKEDEIEYAMNNYSKLYSIKGEEMFLIYDGIEESLRRLKESGCKLAIVTQKNAKFINNMLGVYKTIGEQFDIVCATDVDIDMEKSDMLLKVCEELGISVEDSIFIGDSYVDALAAQEVGMDFAAALYGWGFRSREDVKDYPCALCINSAAELFKKISERN